ncbi:MAG TPA: hypothetical protein DCP97_05640 [Ruminococcaceae bacterium]|nr:hypothetical protein [Oscillospiraceae bacterium]
MKRAFKRFLCIALMMSMLSLSLSSYASEINGENTANSTPAGISSVAGEQTVSKANTVSPGISNVAQEINGLKGHELVDCLRGMTDAQLGEAIELLTDEQLLSIDSIISQDEKDRWSMLYVSKQALNNQDEQVEYPKKFDDDFANGTPKIGSIDNISTFSKQKVYLMSAAALEDKGKQLMQNSHNNEKPPVTLSKKAYVLNENERTYTIGLSAVLNEDVFVPSQCDIALVLDKSDSMDEYVYSLITSPPDTNKNDYYYDSGVMLHKVWYSRLSKKWYYNSLILGFPIEVLPYQNGKYQFYTRQTKFNLLKEAANSFVASVADKSPLSRIAIVSFATDAAIDINLTSAAENGGVNPKFKKIIDGLRLGSYSSTDEALLKVKQVFASTANQGEERKKVVVMITDGEAYNPYNDDYYDDTKDYAEDLKEDPFNATIFAIGVFNEPPDEDTRNLLKDISGTISSDDNDGYNLVLNDIGKLPLALGLIAEQTEPKQIDAVIRDYISEHFEIVSAPDDAVVSKDSENRTYIEWTKHLDAQTSFEASFAIKAKDSYFGGNDTPTNIGGISGIYKNNEIINPPFDVPTVNVPINFSVSNASDTFYASEKIKLTEELANRMYNSADAANGKIDFTWKKNGAAVDEFTAINDETYTLEATYTPNSSGADSAGTPIPKTTKNGSYSVSVLKPVITAENVAAFAGEQIDLSKLISVNWNTPAGYDRQAPVLNFKMFENGNEIKNTASFTTFKDTSISIKAYSGNFSLDDNSCIGGYVNNPFAVTVQRGSITAIKTIDKNREAHGDPIFIFKLERCESGKVKQTWYDYVRFSNGTTNAQAVTFGGLPKGEYRLSEIKAIRYDFNAITSIIGGQKLNGNTASFSINSDNTNGEAAFYNIKSNEKLFTHTDAFKNSFTIKP